MSVEAGLRVCMWTAAALVLGMVGIFLATGVGQDPLQFVHEPEVYRSILLARPGVLRAVLGLDDAFLILYTAGFVALGWVLPDPRARVGAALLVAVGALDLLENAHFLAMLGSAELGAPPGPAEISAQVVESVVKFHVSYAALLVLSLGLPRDTRAHRLLADLGIYLQAPVGVLIHVAPASVAVPLVFVRFSYFLVALVLTGWLFGRSGSGARR